MVSTIQKWVLNVMTPPNPTQYTKLHKYQAKPQTRNWSEINGLYKYIYIKIYLFFLLFSLIFVPCVALRRDLAILDLGYLDEQTASSLQDTPWGTWKYVLYAEK